MQQHTDGRERNYDGIHERGHADEVHFLRPDIYVDKVQNNSQNEKLSANRQGKHLFLNAAQYASLVDYQKS